MKVSRPNLQKDIPMTSIPISDLLTIIFVVVDDWYKTQGARLLKGKPGAKPQFTDSEVITLMLAMDFVPFPGETQFLGYIRANYLCLFPRLLDQSQFNRRARGLRLLVEELRRYSDSLSAGYQTSARDGLQTQQKAQRVCWKR